MNWEVQIAGHSTVLDDLCQVLNGGQLIIEKRENGYFLTSPDFIHLIKPEDVEVEAQKILNQISGSVRQLLAPNSSLRVAHIAELRKNGTFEVTSHLIDKVTVCVTEKLEIRRDGELIHQSSTYDGVAQHLSVARKEPAVASVL